MVGASHREREATQRHAAPAVGHAQEHLSVGAIPHARRPPERGPVAVAGGGALDQRVLFDRQALRAGDDLPVEEPPIGVPRAEGGGPGLAGLRGRQRGGTEIEFTIGLDQAQGRRKVVLRHGVEAVAEIELDPRAAARRAAEAAGRTHGDCLRGQGLAAPERFSGQRRAEVQQPQVRLGSGSPGRAEDRVAEVTTGIDQQRERAAEIVRADVGDRHVVAEGAAQAIGAGVGKPELDAAGEVGNGGEDEAESGTQVELSGAAQAGVQFEPPAAGRQLGQGQDSALARHIPAHALGVQRELAVGARRDQVVVAGVEDRAGAGGVVARGTGPHRLVETHRELRQRQRYQRAFGEAGRDDTGRFGRSELVDALGFGHQHAAIGRGDDAFAARAAFGQLERAPGRQFDRPDGAAVGKRAATGRHRALRRVGAGEQQPRQARAGSTEGQTVHQPGNAEFQLGAAGVAAAHREAEDVGGRVGQGRHHVGASPAHRPEAAVRAEGQIADAGVAEVGPGLGSAGGPGVEDFDAAAAGDINGSAAGIDRQRMGERCAGRRARAAEDRAAGGIQLQEFGAGHDPEVAGRVQRHVVYGGG